MMAKQKTTFFIIVGLAVAIVLTTHLSRQLGILTVSVTRIRVDVRADVTPDLDPTAVLSTPAALWLEPTHTPESKSDIRNATPAEDSIAWKED
jgi:hypothetical protein